MESHVLSRLGEKCVQRAILADFSGQPSGFRPPGGGAVALRHPGGRTFSPGRWISRFTHGAATYDSEVMRSSAALWVVLPGRGPSTIGRNAAPDDEDLPQHDREER